jgi:hypothetical protein
MPDQSLLLLLQTLLFQILFQLSGCFFAELQLPKRMLPHAFNVHSVLRMPRDLLSRLCLPTCDNHRQPQLILL